ncbi:hypothetical protein Tco_1031500 [Tanacetum coccineum]|uniref:Uncharacterized protein n=1 Tax=Tanacetum coccineum TaxID=301880 RepID=A0ABQ5GAX3_9ASTR
MSRRYGHMMQNMKKTFIHKGNVLTMLKNVDDALKEVIPKIVTKTTEGIMKDNLPWLVVNNDPEAQAANSAIWDALRKKYEKSSILPATYRPEASRKRESSSAKGTSSSKITIVPKPKTHASQPPVQEYNEWSMAQEVNEDEDISEEAKPEFLAEIQGKKWVPTIADFHKIKFVHDDILKTRLWESRQEDITRQFLEKPTQVFQGCERDPNAPTRYLYNKDLFFLKNGNSDTMKYLLSLHKIYTTLFPKDDLEEVLKRWVGKVITRFNVPTRLSIQHWKRTWEKMYYWQCHNITRSDPDDVFSDKKIIDIIRVLYHDAYRQELIDEVCVKRDDDKAYLFTESDFKYLNKIDIEDMRRGGRDDIGGGNGQPKGGLRGSGGMDEGGRGRSQGDGYGRNPSGNRSKF